MKILVINGTEQKGCTYQMKEQLLEALGRENETEELYLPAACPVFCTGCKACFYKDISVCPHKEYTVPIWEKISTADLLVFTSPVYVFHLTAQMKALLDHYGTKWMAHSPEAQMFSKQAIIITSAAGAGMKNVAKDIGDSLRYWGVARIFTIKQAMFESRWELVEPKRKASVKKQCEKAAVWLKQPEKVKPDLGCKMRFYTMCMAQKMINRTLQKAGQPETRDYTYWKQQGWLDGKTPWSM